MLPSICSTFGIATIWFFLSLFWLLICTGVMEWRTEVVIHTWFNSLFPTKVPEKYLNVLITFQADEMMYLYLLTVEEQNKHQTKIIHQVPRLHRSLNEQKDKKSPVSLSPSENYLTAPDTMVWWFGDTGLKSLGHHFPVRILTLLKEKKVLFEW